MKKAGSREDEQRRRAEELLNQQRATGMLLESTVPVERLRHELQVHQIELETQNDELRAAVQQLEQSRLKYQELYDSAPVGYFSVDGQWVILEANLTAAKLLGVTRNSLIGQSISRFVPEPGLDLPALLQEQQLDSGSCREWEMRMQRVDGSPFWASLQSVSPRSSSTISRTYLVTMTVIDQRKKFEVEIIRDKALLRCVIDSVADHIFIKDMEGGYLDCNEAFHVCIGLPTPGINGGGAAGHCSGERGQGGAAAVKPRGCGNESRKEEWVTCLDGSRRLLDTIETPYYGPEGEQLGFVGISRDITERVQLERALHDSEEQFRTLCDAAPVGIFRLDREGNTVYCNPRWEQITGTQAPTGAVKDWLLGIHPDDAGEFGRIWSEARANGGSICHEHRRLLPDGSTVWARVLLTPLSDSNGTVQSHVGTLEDITGQRQSRHDLLKNQKLDSLGVLAGGIAHDFNNLLTGIFGNISLARFQLHDAVLAAKKLEDAENAIVRAADLTKQLLTFARGGEPVKQVVDLNLLLQKAAGVMLQGSQIRSEFQLAADLPPVEADYEQLSQVIHNLVLNAVQAMPGGGTVTIGSEKVSSWEQGASFARIWVADTGTGINEENMQRIFDPYFTTRASGKGLGLATCHSIVRKHGGKIRAESSVGKGSRFIISLPAAERAYVADPDAPDTVYAGTGRVLLMDDNDDIRITAQGILQELGYQVEVAVDGVQALESYRRAIEQGTPFSAAILDLTIPEGMGGRETIEELLKMDPAVKAIVSSGYSDDPVLANYLKYGFCAVLNKPYRLQEMSRVLKRLLEP